MGNYTGPKVRLSRRLGVPIAETGKHLNLRRPNRPGMHGYRRPRPTLYGRQLMEKQKIAFYYNIRDAQFRRYISLARKSSANSSTMLQQMLESRLDNVVRRLGWARTIWQARQAVVHGHFLVNNRKVSVPSFQVRPGDVVCVKERSRKFVQACTETCEGPLAPGWLSPVENKLEAHVVRLPAPEDVRLPFEVEYASIIEYYGR